MGKSRLNLSLYTPERAFFERLPVRQVQAPSIRGEVGILPGHASMISLLSAGALRYTLLDSGEERSMAAAWGYLEVKGEDVTVLAESIQTKEALDRDQAEEELRELEKSLSQIDLNLTERKKLEKRRRQLEAYLRL